MKVLHSWLQKYISFPFRPEELAEKLGMLGLEIDNIEYLGKEYDGFIVGKVLNVERHPNADRLTVCKVETGKGVLQVVCGAPNVAEGQKVAVGLVGATVSRNQHDPARKPFVLSKATIRGVESHGMICSAFELVLGDDAEGIMVLDRKAVVGTPLAQYLGIEDVAYDLEVTPNRPDWLGHIGVAREIGVVVGKSITPPVIRLKESGTAARTHIAVRVEDRVNCERFAVRVIMGAKIGPSPEWLQRALLGVGLRPVNNIVDVTNYVMMETGQPLHAFDYALLLGKRLVVRQREQAGEFTTLDGRTYRVPEGAVMVCDAEREISIAGVMGGANSQIGPTSEDIVIESACWNPSNIRRTAKLIGVSTDASYRFERGVDHGGILYALNRAAQLVSEIAGGQIQKGIVDVHSRRLRQRLVPLHHTRANSLLGTSFSQRDISRLLKPLGIRPSAMRKGAPLYKVPTFRVDIEREIDLIEEVARVYGYDRIEETSAATVTMSHQLPAPDAGEEVRAILIGAGFQEAITNPLQDSHKATTSGKNPIQLSNARSKELDSLRTSLVPGLLSVVSGNHRHGNFDLRLFEVGHVFSRDTSPRPKLVADFLEEEHLALVMTGLTEPRHWGNSARTVDFFDLKGEVDCLLRKVPLDKCQFIYYSTSNSLVEDCVGIEINGANAGYLGRVRAEFLNFYEIDSPVLVSEIQLDAFNTRNLKRYKPFPRFPKVKRDVALIVDQGVRSDRVQELLQASSSGLITNVELFDVYQEERLPPGKKSLAFSIEMTPKERTLTDEEIEREVNAAVKVAEREVGAMLRGF